MNQSNDSKTPSRSKSRCKVDEEQPEPPEQQELQNTPPEPTPSVEKPKQCFRHPFWNFLRDFREELKQKGLKVLSKEIAKQAGQRWRTMTLDERSPYILEANAVRMADGNKVIKRKPYKTVNNVWKCPGCGNKRKNTKYRKQSYSTISSDSSATSYSQSDSLSDTEEDDGDSAETTTVTSVSSESSESCESSS